MWILALPALTVALLILSILLLWGAWGQRHRRSFSGFLLLAGCLLLGAFMALNLYSRTLAFHPFAPRVGTAKADSSHLRVLSYNVWNEGQYMGPHKGDCGPELLASVEAVHADVVMLCELHYSNNPLTIDSLRRLYPYNTMDLLDNNGSVSGQIFSRWPVSNVRQLFYNDTAQVRTSSATWLTEIETPKGKINFLSVHLKTNGVQAIRDSVPRDSILTLPVLRRFAESTRRAYACRQLEAAALRDSIDCMQGPVLAAGDFNDLSGSVSLNILQYGSASRFLDDAWWEGGFGLGLTYYMHHLHLRLDHILYSGRDFELHGIKVLSDWKYSDHYPLVADFSLK